MAMREPPHIIPTIIATLLQSTRLDKSTYLRWTILEHDADRSVPSRKVYAASGIEELIADLPS
jgi:hypothetical protein